MIATYTDLSPVASWAVIALTLLWYTVQSLLLRRLW